jgi:electron transfer flavoprotein beta subunit
MRILVFVKTVLDPHAQLRFTPDGQVEQDESEPLALLNPADRCALEEAMRLKAQHGREVTAISLGTELARLGLQVCLGRGADRAIHLRIPPGTPLDSLAKANLLAEAARREGFDLILCGEKSLDGGSGATGPMLAEMLDLPQMTRVVCLDVHADANGLIAERALERGDRVRVASSLPALVSVTAQINTPRYVSYYKAHRAAYERLEVREIPSVEKIVPSPGMVENGWPKPRPRKVNAPNKALSASDRMNALMSGGRAAQPKKDGGIFDGSTQEAVERVIEFLTEKGFL